MKTLKEYADFLHENGYKETSRPFTYLDGHLIAVDFIKNDFLIKLSVDETKEFSEYLSSLEPGTEYKSEYENYIVKSAFIESPICNVNNKAIESKYGIELISKPTAYNKHTLDMFEWCINFQKTNLLEHELFIMSRREEQLVWAKDNLIPLLEKWDFCVDYDSFFHMEGEKNSSNTRIDFKHPHRVALVMETDCLTGKPFIWVDFFKRNGCFELTDKIYGKNLDEVGDILLEELLKKDELRFGYIYNNDPHETFDTDKEVLTLFRCLHDKKKGDINFNVIPKRYENFVEEYHKMVTKS